MGVLLPVVNFRMLLLVNCATNKSPLASKVKETGLLSPDANVVSVPSGANSKILLP